ncbi:helix-turn-helix transcriptional regulator [Mesobacillus foraminis]|uniref:Helix-turn-helix protein n=1 Tax=Mesobacillus foraminis TaxID=279826 RepID=A0A4R2AX12_9BACI|nr:helix-turn-helix transcriptional regulator [Mesobacillus foraminis]TCN17542.1 helix-turn-helix protein [Mesobacillus foraminis]
MHVGKSIRFHRTKMSLTQEELATGLISVSYLSKIENGQINASPEILEELLNRLNIADAVPQDQKLCEDLRHWYQQIISRNKYDSIETYNRLSREITNNSSFEPYSLFRLFCVRYFLTLGKLEEAEKLLKQLSVVAQDFSKELSYYYFKFKGNYEYLNKQFEHAFNSYKEAEFLFEANTPSLEKADVFYSLGLTGTKIEKHLLAVLFTTQALDIFREIYNLERSSDCHLLLGILYQRLDQFDEAETNFKWANKLARQVGNQDALGVIEHNLGHLYDLRGDKAKALDHYKKSLELKQELNYDGKLTTILFILKALYNEKENMQTQYWIRQGELYAKKTRDIGLKHEFNMFMHLHNKEFEEFVYYTKRIALPYFEKNRLYRNASYYSEILAEYFKENRKYKLSSHYFEYCKEILKKIYK